MGFITDPNAIGAQLNDGFLDSIWDYAKTTGSNIVSGATNKVVSDAKNAINEKLGIQSPVPTTTNAVPTETTQTNNQATTSVQTTTPSDPVKEVLNTAQTSATTAVQTQLEAWKSWLSALTNANCKTELDKLTPEQKTQAEAAAKALGISIPCGSTTAKAKGFLMDNKDYLLAAGIGAGGYLLSKSIWGAALAGAGTYFLSKKFLK